MSAVGRRTLACKRLTETRTATRVSIGLKRVTRISRFEGFQALLPVVRPSRHQRVGSQRDMDVQAQVNRLIKEARSHENLCQMFVGWNSFW